MIPSSENSSQRRTYYFKSAPILDLEARVLFSPHTNAELQQRSVKERIWNTPSALSSVIAHHHSALCVYQSFRQQNGPYSVDWGWKLQLLHTEQRQGTALPLLLCTRTHIHTRRRRRRGSCSSLFVWCFAFALIARLMPFKSFASILPMQIQLHKWVTKVLHWHTRPGMWMQWAYIWGRFAKNTVIWRFYLIYFFD